MTRMIPACLPHSSPHGVLPPAWRLQQVIKSLPGKLVAACLVADVLSVKGYALPVLRVV